MVKNTQTICYTRNWKHRVHGSGNLRDAENFSFMATDRTGFINLMIYEKINGTYFAGWFIFNSAG